MLTLWLGFIVCTCLIIYSGIKLAKYGDVIAEKTGLGKAWTGVVLIASVTSLPELVTGVSSVTFAEVPDIAVGDALGSCVFNMLIIALLDAVTPITPISTRAHHGNVLSAGFGILLLSMSAVSLFLGKSLSPIGWIGPYTLLFVILYFVAMRSVFFYERKHISQLMKEIAGESRYKSISQKDALIKYGINALIVIGAATFLPLIGKGIAEASGLGQTFVGNIFIAVSTSLPELVVCLAAVKLNAIDLAIGNLFGSNVFNIFILAIDDMFFIEGPLLSVANPNHIISSLAAIAMSTIAVIGLTYRAEKKPLFLAWDSMGILLIYVINIMLLYGLR